VGDSTITGSNILNAMFWSSFIHPTILPRYLNTSFIPPTLQTQYTQSSSIILFPKTHISDLVIWKELYLLTTSTVIHHTNSFNKTENTQCSGNYITYSPKTLFPTQSSTIIPVVKNEMLSFIRNNPECDLIFTPIQYQTYITNYNGGNHIQAATNSASSLNKNKNDSTDSGSGGWFSGLTSLWK
jgi:hypothetical protein